MNFLLGLYLLWILATPTFTAASDLLIINSYDPRNEWELGIDRGVIRAVDESGLNIRIFREYLHNVETSDDHMPSAYLNARPCAILAVDDKALDYIVEKKLRGEWFFVGINSGERAMASGARAGVVESIPVIELYRMISALHPAARKIVAVGSRVPDHRFNKLVAVAQDAYPQWEVSRRLVRDVAAFKAWSRSQVDTVLIVFGLKGLGAGYMANPYAVFGEIGLPSYTFWDAHGIGGGVIGGLIAIAEEHGLAVGQKIVTFFRLGGLTGANIDYYIPPKYLFDMSQITRHGIDVARLPASAQFVDGPAERVKSPWLALALSYGGLFLFILVIDFLLVKRKAELKTRLTTALSLFTLIGGWMASIFISMIEAWLSAD